MFRISFLIAVMTFMYSIALFVSCSNEKSKSLNPNGDSELALLMREMYEDGMRTKQQILEGKTPEVKVKYHQLTTAKPSVPEKVDDPKYAGFAAMYESSVDSLLNANKENRVEAFHSMVDACMNCHHEVCPGPKVKIRKLYLSEEEISDLILIEK